MRKLAELSGPINIFSQQLATRDALGWTITEAGRNFLRRLEDAQELEQTEPAGRTDLRPVCFEQCGAGGEAAQAGRLKVARVPESDRPND